MNIEVFHLNNALNKNNSDQFSYWCLTNCVSRMDLADDKIFSVLTRKIQSLTCIFCVCKIVSKMSDILCLYYVSKTSHKMLVMPETDFT